MHKFKLHNIDQIHWKKYDTGNQVWIIADADGMSAFHFKKNILPRPTQGERTSETAPGDLPEINQAETSRNTWTEGKKKKHLSLWTQAVQMTVSAFCFADLHPDLPFSFTSLWEHNDRRIKVTPTESCADPKAAKEETWFSSHDSF